MASPWEKQGREAPFAKGNSLPTALILQAVNWCRHSSAAMDKAGRRGGTDGHDGCGAEEAAEADLVAYRQTIGRDQADGGGLCVGYTNRNFIGDDAADHVFGGIAGMAIISKPTEQTAVMASNFSSDSAPRGRRRSCPHPRTLG